MDLPVNTGLDVITRAQAIMLFFHYTHKFFVVPTQVPTTVLFSIFSI